MGIKAKVGFYPSWWFRNYGISFGRDFFWNPDYRVDAQLKMQRILHERFGDVGMGSADPQPEGYIDYGMVLLPEIFGCEVVFEDEAQPWAIPMNLSEEQVMQLEVPDLLSSPVMRRMVDQLSYLEEKYGRVTGSLNPTGVQNLALKLRGEELYIDYYTNPEVAEKVLEVSTEAILQLGRYLRDRLGILAPAVTPMAPEDMFIEPNCTLAQVSNDTFERFLLRHESRLAEELHPFGIHHCGNGDELVPGYAKIPHLDFLEVGPKTDLRRLREFMPRVHINARVDPVRMLNEAEEVIRADVREIVDTGGPLELLSVDAVGCDFGTPDANVRAMLQEAKAYSEQVTKEGVR